MGVIIYGEGTNSLSSNQTTEIYLEDYTNSELTKQLLIDLLLSEIYDSRDGVILRHTNNVQVDITRKSDNVIIDSITQEGFYDIRMTVSDSDDNIGTTYWKNRNESLNVDVLTLLVKENKPPVITLNEIRIFNLIDYGTIQRVDLLNELVNVVIDDRDGIITTDILNVRIFQTGIDGGTNAVDNVTYFNASYGTNIIQIIPTTEILFINEIGEYVFVLTVTDSDNTTTTANFTFNVE